MEEGGGPRAAGDTGENLIEVRQWRWGIGMGVDEDLGVPAVQFTAASCQGTGSLPLPALRRGRGPAEDLTLSGSRGGTR